MVKLSLYKLKLSVENDELFYKDSDDRIALYKNYNNHIYIVWNCKESIPKDLVCGIRIGNTDLYANIFNPDKNNRVYDYTFISLSGCRYIIHINNIDKCREIINQYNVSNEPIDFETYTR